MAKRAIRIPELCEKVEALAARGLNMEQIAASLGVSDRWLYQKKAKSTKVAAAWKRGKQRMISQVVNSIFVNATQRHNLGAQIFILTNQDSENWQNTQHKRISGAQGEPLIEKSSYKPEDYEKAIADIDARFD